MYEQHINLDVISRFKLAVVRPAFLSGINFNVGHYIKVLNLMLLYLLSLQVPLTSAVFALSIITAKHVSLIEFTLVIWLLSIFFFFSLQEL